MAEVSKFHIFRMIGVLIQNEYPRSHRWLRAIMICDGTEYGFADDKTMIIFLFFITNQ